VKLGPAQPIVRPTPEFATSPPTARAKADEIRALASQGLSMGAIAQQLGIGKGSVHRVLSHA
jgi:DNA-binding NarL/FixJ family response regulator